MDRSFDLRLSIDRHALADLLPRIDQYELAISREDFVATLAAIDEYLGSPSWFVYQFGAFVIPTGGSTQWGASLPQVLEIGQRLLRLSRFRGFTDFVRGFRNPSQFEGTAFEAEAADYVAGLPSVRDLVFSPEYLVRGRRKHADFDAYRAQGLVTAECKRPQPHLQRFFHRANRLVNAIKTEVDARLPSDRRLEIEIAGAVRGSDAVFARYLLDLSLGALQNGREEVSLGPVRGRIVPVEAELSVDGTGFGIHVMTLPANEATRLFNPRLTRLAVSHNLDQQRRAAVRDRATEALTELPTDHDGLIFLGHVPHHLARPVCDARLADPAYRHVRAFGLLGDGQIIYVCRTGDDAWLQEFAGTTDVRPVPLDELSTKPG